MRSGMETVDGDPRLIRYAHVRVEGIAYLELLKGKNVHSFLFEEIRV